MYYRHPTEHVEFEIPDAWWVVAGATNFVPTRLAFVPATDPNWPTVLVPISDVEVPRRNDGVVGLHEDRTTSLLRAFFEESAVPPVEVHEPPGQNACRFMIRNGYHRYFLSIAVGYTLLPVSIRPYVDFNTL